MTPHTHRTPLPAAVPPAARGLPGPMRRAELREALADRIERYLAILDRLDGDPDLEDGADAEPSLGSLGSTAASRGSGHTLWLRGGTDDREDGDDTGIGDVQGLAEQRGRHLRLVTGGAA